MLKVLPSVKPKAIVIIAAATNAARALSIDVVVTSVNDGQHMPQSKHYDGDAVDFRTKHLSALDKQLWIKHTLDRLGNEYQGLLEDEGKPNEHLHIERDPT